jgi:glycosyltransferase involved in cell wall biosynthesis
VILFCRNTAATVERAIQSVVSQHSDAIELVVMDGGSTDGTLEILRRYEPHIAVLHSGPDGGPTAAINQGVRRASGEVIALLPGDDWLEPGALTRVVQEFAADPDLDVLSCGTRYVRIDERGAVRTLAEFTDARALAFTLRGVLRHPLTAGRFIRRRRYLEMGGHSTECVFGDYDFLLRLCLAKVRSKVRCELTYTYRAHAQSTTFAGRPETIMIMMCENMRMASRYLQRGVDDAADRRALLRLHAGSAVRLFVMKLARGKASEAFGAFGDAFRVNPVWPLAALSWYSGSIASKLRHSFARRFAR